MDFSAFTDWQIQDARSYAAGIYRQLAKEAMTADYYASHVTKEDRLKIQEDNLKLAEEIENGQHDHNFTIRQSMYYYLTGESVAFLP